MTERVYGHTASGKPITEDLIDRLSQEAERGYDVQGLLSRRGPGRPRLGEAAKTVESVRLDSALRDQIAQRAESDGVSTSEVIRRALREYLRGA
jgi:hypothetical protein